MTEKQMTKADRIKFSDLTTKEQVVNFITGHFDLKNLAETFPTPAGTLNKSDDDSSWIPTVYLIDFGDV
jgi:hypothetical protein